MKTLFRAFVVLALLLAQPAKAQIKGSPYVTAEVGASFLEETTAHTTFFSTPVDATVRFDPGYRLDISVGYFVPNGAALTLRGSEAVCHFAVELDTGFIYNRIETGAGVSADFSQVPLLANAMVIFPFTEKFSVTLGMGVGGAFVMTRISDSLMDAESTSFGFAYQGLARLSYQFTPHFSVSAFGKVLVSPSTNLPEETLDGPLSISGGVGFTYLF